MSDFFFSQTEGVNQTWGWQFSFIIEKEIKQLGGTFKNKEF